MTAAQATARSLRQFIPLFWVLGIIATLGYAVMILNLFSSVREDEAVNGGALLALLVQMMLLWIGLAWMGLVARGLAELLAPSSPE